MESTPILGRYRFYTIFNYNPATGLFSPLYNVRVNGILYPKNQPIPQPTNFGGLNLLTYLGKDIAAIWNSDTRILDIRGFYP